MKGKAVVTVMTVATAVKKIDRIRFKDSRIEECLQ